jgi:hypothetical protein
MVVLDSAKQFEGAAFCGVLSAKLLGPEIDAVFCHAYPCSHASLPQRLILIVRWRVAAKFSKPTRLSNFSREWQRESKLRSRES